jgi:hypothetical protein
LALLIIIFGIDYLKSEDDGEQDDDKDDAPSNNHDCVISGRGNVHHRVLVCCCCKIVNELYRKPPKMFLKRLTLEYQLFAY